MQAIDGLQDNQGALSLQSMAFRPRRYSSPHQSLKWAPRKTALFVFASSTFLWTAIATATWLIL
jgi:hypothetical protein